MIEILNDLYRQLDDKQAEDIIVLDVQGLTSISDYFVIASADNPRKVKAIADHVEKFMAENNISVKFKEGLDSSKWILLDFSNIIVHIFENEEREYYNLERIWKDGINITPDK